MDVIIRAMQPQDYETYYSFLSELHALHVKERPDIFRPKVGVPPREVFESDLQKGDREYFLAVAGTTAAGMCTLLWKERKDDPDYPLLPCRSGHIDDLFVAPEFRGQGIGTQLYREAERRARERGVDNLTLMVWAFNENALRLYQKLGMKPLLFNMEQRL